MAKNKIMKILMIVIDRWTIVFFHFLFFFFLFFLILSILYVILLTIHLVLFRHRYRTIMYIAYPRPFENPFNCVRALSISIELLPMLIRDTDISTGIWIYLGHRLSLPSDRFIVHSPIPHYSSLH